MLGARRQGLLLGPGGPSVAAGPQEDVIEIRRARPPVVDQPDYAVEVLDRVGALPVQYDQARLRPGEAPITAGLSVDVPTAGGGEHHQAAFGHGQQLRVVVKFGGLRRHLHDVLQRSCPQHSLLLAGTRGVPRSRTTFSVAAPGVGARGPFSGPRGVAGPRQASERKIRAG